MAQSGANKCWRTRPRLLVRRICLSAQTWKIATRTIPTVRQTPFAWRLRRDWRAARSRMYRGVKARGHTSFHWQPSAFRAAAEAAHSMPFSFTLTARAENYIIGRPDLRDTIARLQAFQEAGADVLFAPGLKTREEIVAVVRSVDRPVNVIMGLQSVQLNLDELSEMGVKRISVGSALSRAALSTFYRAALQMKEHKTFTFAEDALKVRELNAMFEKWALWVLPPRS